MKNDFVVGGHFDAVVGARMEEVNSSFFYIFEKVRKCQNARELLRSYSWENISKKLTEKYGREVSMNDLEIFTCEELAGTTEKQMDSWRGTDGIGKKIPKDLIRFINEKQKKIRGGYYGQVGKKKSGKRSQRQA